MRFFTALGMFITDIAFFVLLSVVMNVLVAAFGLWFLIPMMTLCLVGLFYTMWNAVK